MTPFQVFGLSALILFAGLTARATARRRLTRKSGILWMTLWALAAITISFPELTTRMAALVGIGRGADLVLYTGLLATLGGFLVLNSRLRRVESDLTKLVRELALQDANTRQTPSVRLGPEDGD